MRICQSRFALVATLLAVSPIARAVTVTTAADLAAALATPGTTVELSNNIDMTGWTTVADFSGTIDGKGYSLVNLDAPLLGAVTGDVEIRDLTVQDANVSVPNNTAVPYGILLKSATAANLTIEGVTFTGSTLRNATNKGDVGFVVGKFTVTGTASFQNCLIDDTCSFAVGVVLHGGIVGSGTAQGTDATISFTHCVMEAAISYTMSYGSQFGGLAGSLSVQGSGGNANQYAHLYMDGCTNRTSTVIGNNSNRGFAGLVYSAGCGNSSHKGNAVITRCANYGSCTSTGGFTTTTNFGGLLGGWSNGQLTMEDCVNYGSILCSQHDDSRPSIGGMVGNISAPIQTTVTLTGCANLGDLSGLYAGGMVGTLSHNGSYKSNKVYIRSCMNTGTLTTLDDTKIPGQAICMLTTGAAYPQIDVEGCLWTTNTLIGTYAEGASVTAYNTADNVFLNASEGLVDGTDLAALNAYPDADSNDCNLWKQGHEYPILKILPNEAAPDTITATFEDWDGTVLKQVTIARGWQCYPPADPERDGCTFLGWDPSVFFGLTQNTTFTAQYSAGLIEHTVSFLDWDDTPLCADQTIAHGNTAVAPADPTRANYLFIGWSAPFDNVTDDLVIHAQYVALDQYVSTPEQFAAAVTADTHAGVSVHLSANIVLPADWTAPDFHAVFDGAGHVISCADGGLPLFNHLYGSASNFVLNAESAGTPLEMSIANNISFGAVAKVVDGGLVENVTIANLTVKTGTGNNVGLIAGELGNGGAILGCTTADSCSLRHKQGSAGGIVGSIFRTTDFAPVDGENNPIRGMPLVTIADCTNNAPLVQTGTSGFRAGGIVGVADVHNTTYRPDIIILRCANHGDLTAVAGVAAASASVGGILGQRSVNASGHGGVLRIMDCSNDGDIVSPCTGSGSLGGIVGYFWRGCEAVFDRCVNRGAIGTEFLADGTTAVTANSAGGLIGFASSLYSGNPVSVTNSANYGAITAGSYAGGLVGHFDANGGHNDTKIMFYNCANYGAPAATAANGLTGQIFARFDSLVNNSSSRQYGAVNSFFITDDFYADDSGSRIILEGLVTAEDAGYKAAAAKRQLNAAVEESEGAYEPWMVGFVGPELLPFWDHYQPCTLIQFR